MTLDCSGVGCVFLDYVVPSFGVVTLSLISFSPLPAVLKVRNEKVLGPMNPLPFPLLFLNALTYELYGLYVRNYFMAFVNIIGTVLALFYSISVLELGHNISERVKLRIEGILLIGLIAVFLCAVVSFVVLYPVSDPESLTHGLTPGKHVLGILGGVLLFSFYFAPLMTLLSVIKSKCSASINIFISVASLINSVLWGIYGMVLSDPYIYAPNIPGVLFSIAQIIIYVKYPQTVQVPHTTTL